MTSGEEARESGPEARVFDRAQFLEMLRAKRYEEALDALYRMRAAAPDNPSVSRGIQVLKEKLLTDFQVRLGSPGQVVLKVSAPSTSIPPEEGEILALVDGVATLQQVLDRSLSGRLPAARALCALLERGLLALAEAPEAAGDSADAADPVRYEDLFHQAMEAYLRRDIDTALTLFGRCLEERPHDTRVQHNIERLRQRKGAP